MNAPARQARFDRSTQHRRAMLAKIHIAKKTLAIDEDDYRQIIFDETDSKHSLTECSEAELEKIIARLKRLGFRPIPKKGGKPAAQHPMARKARAMWISLYQLGAVHNPSEEALEAFACKQLGCEKLVWARQSDGYKLIEALKSMATRAGWRQMDLNGKKLPPLTLQYHLCEVILAKLQETGSVPANWSLHEAAWRLCGVENGKDTPWSADDYQRLADGLGRKLRALRQVQDERGGAA